MNKTRDQKHSTTLKLEDVSIVPTTGLQTRLHKKAQKAQWLHEMELLLPEKTLPMVPTTL